MYACMHCFGAGLILTDPIPPSQDRPDPDPWFIWTGSGFESRKKTESGSITLYPCEFSISFLTMTWIETGTESSGSTENWKSDQDPNSGKKTGSYRIRIRNPACMLWMPLYAIVTRAPNANQPIYQPTNKQTINHPTNRPHRPIRVHEHIHIICIIQTSHKYL